MLSLQAAHDAYVIEFDTVHLNVFLISEMGKSFLPLWGPQGPHEIFTIGGNGKLKAIKTATRIFMIKGSTSEVTYTTDKAGATDRINNNG